MGTKVIGLNLGYMGGDRELLVFPHPNYILTSQRREATHVWCKIPALGYIIEHPDGRVLFETGISSQWREEWPQVWQYLLDMSEVTPEVCLEARLKELKLGPEDFKYVVMGHLHLDHAGGLRLFEEAGTEIVVHEDEYKHVLQLQLDEEKQQANFYAYSPRDWAFLNRRRPLTVYGDQELLKDLWLVSLPGHTPGTMGLMVRLPHTGWVLMTSDALYTHESYGPPPVGTPVTWNTEKWRQSVEKIRRLASSRDAFIFPGHDERGIKHTGEKTEFKEIKYHPGYVYE